jgi:DNA-directed RNA polymerase
MYLDEIPEALVQRELDNEALAAETAVAAYHARIAEKGTDTSSSRPEQQLLNDAIGPVVAKLKVELLPRNGNARFYVVRKYLAELEPYELAFLAVRHCVNSLTAVEPIQRTARKLGEEIEYHLNFTRFRKAHPYLVKLLHEKLKLASSRHKSTVMTYNMNGRADTWERTSFDEETRIQLGKVLIDCCVQATGLFRLSPYHEEKAKGTGPREASLRLDYGTRRVATKDRTGREQVVEMPLSKWLESKHAFQAQQSIAFPPMLVPPLPWESGDLYSGGYLSNFASRRLPLVRTRRKWILRELGQMDLSRVCEAVNIAQATAWRINKPLLEVLQWAYEQGGDFAGLPPIRLQETIVERPLFTADGTPWPSEDCRKEVWESFKERYKVEVQDHFRAVHVANEEWVRNTSKRKALFMKLSMARKYAGEHSIYFPHFLDWRGRIYPAVGHLNPQADDCGKALLEFSEGKALGERGLYWLKVHAANCYGIDKVAFEERIKWVDENMGSIIEAARHPKESNFWYADGVDSPWKFLAACFELERTTHTGTATISHLPIAMDGSCNSYQHYAGLLRDPLTGSKVNLIPSSKPSDIYADIAEQTNELLKEEASNELAQLWIGKVSRSVCKRGTMTKVYGVSTWGIGDQLKGEFGSLMPKEQATKACSYLAGLIERSLNLRIPAATEGMDYLQAVAEAIGEDKPLWWTTPSGFKVFQDYRRTKSVKINLFFGTQRLQASIRKDTDAMDKRGMKNAVAPCYVHSLDASHLMLTLIRCKEASINSFATVHDSYAAHASDTDKLNEILRDVFVRMYEANPLQRFHEEALSQAPDPSKLPSPPTQRGLDLGVVRDSPYFFA